MEKIVVAIDGSEFANKGLEEAIKIAKKFNSKIYLIYVGEPIDFEEESCAEAYKNATENYARKILGEARQRIEKEGLEAEEIFCWGRAAEEIVYHASKIGAQLIVIGSRGKAVGRFKRMLIGSVSKEVAERAECSVFIVK